MEVLVRPKAKDPERPGDVLLKEGRIPCGCAEIFGHGSTGQGQFRRDSRGSVL